VTRDEKPLVAIAIFPTALATERNLSAAGDDPAPPPAVPARGWDVFGVMRVSTYARVVASKIAGLAA
jgi:hypothetical protein